MSAPSASYPLLDAIETPADLRHLPIAKLAELSEELRQFLIHSVSTRGGHFAAGLGTVELTIALHYVFDTPRDRLVWDVGHQAYPHKVLTGRRERLARVKQPRGPAALPQPPRKRIRHLWRRPLEHLDQRRPGDGHRGSAAQGRSPCGGHYWRWRTDRGDGVRGAQSCRVPAHRPA